MIAGMATGTFHNKNTGNRYTYKIMGLKRINNQASKEIWFVKVLSGADNESNYSFLGSIQRRADNKFFFKRSEKSRVTEDAISLKTFIWISHHLQEGTLPGHIGIWHAGKCGRCGRTLTVPESIQSGYGPECVTKI